MAAEAFFVLEKEKTKTSTSCEQTKIIFFFDEGHRWRRSLCSLLSLPVTFVHSPSPLPPLVRFTEMEQ